MPFWAKLIVVLSVLWFSITQACAATDAGTAIINQATLTYMDSATGQLVELKSNTSTIQVAPLRQFELLSSNSVVAIAGQSVSLSHSLQNIGNVADRYTLSVENQLADSGDLINLMLYVDANNNGIVDPDESVVDSELSLEAGETISLVITGMLAAELAGNDEVEVVIYAQAVDSDLAVQSNNDVISIQPSAKITMDLQSTHACDVFSSVGERIDFTLVAINQTNTFPTERSVLIDGEQRSGVLLEINLPSGLSLVSGEILDVVAYQGIPVVSESSTADQWMRYEHWTGSTMIDRLALLVPTDNFEAQDPVSIAFSMLIDEQATGQRIFVNGGIDFEFDGVDDVEFLPGCVDVAMLGATSAREIRFVEPSLDLQKNAQTPEFSRDADFVDAPVYRLQQSGIETNQPENDYRLDLNGVYVEMNAVVPEAELIVDASGAKYVVVLVQSGLTGDELHLVLRETEPGTDLYRSIKPVLLSTNLSGDGSFCPGGSNGALPIPADYTNDDDICTLLSEADDTITVSFIYQATGTVISDKAVVDPISRVFDSTSLHGIPDAIVRIVVDGQVQEHPISGLPMVFTTDSEGRYTIPRLPDGESYGVQVQAPDSHVFPSTVEPTRFSSYVVTAASYGVNGLSGSGDGVFTVAAGAAPPIIDIPLDPANRNALLVVEKSAESNSVDVGETLAYRIKIKNLSNGSLGSLSVIDYPAFGFRYIAGSATFDGVAVDDPQRLSVPAGNTADDQDQTEAYVTGLRFTLSQIDANTEGVLRYHMRATAGASDGSGVNRANANATTLSGLVLSTPTSVAKVDIQRSGVMSDQAILFGKVYVDSSCDNIQNQGEWPIGGVRLYLQDGTFVVTDEDGQFSLYGLQPGLHVLKIDNLTLPEGLVLKPTDTRQAADPESRFVDLSAGDFQRADFATFCPAQNADTVFAELKERNLNLRDSWLLNEASRFDPEAKAPRLDVRKRADTDGDLSQGMLGFPRVPNEDKNPNAAIDTNQIAKKITESDDSVLTARTLEKPQMGDPEELVKFITEEQAKQGTWLWPQQDISWDGRFMAVVPAGLDPVLYVNDQPVARTQIGEQIINRRARAQLVAWYGVRLVPGPNQLKIIAKDSFGNQRVLAQGSFRRPSAGVRLLLRTVQDTLEADGGQSSLPIDIVITDAHNNPANGVYFVTLRSNGGEFEEEDLQLREAGMQVRVENGRGRVHLRSTELTGNVQIQARTGALDASLNIVQIAAARPLIGVGVVDIGGQWNRADRGRDQRANLEDGFETDARVAVFLKGRIKNDLHLSLAYDSAKNKNTDVLRDLNPNKHYATYGDSSRRGVEAQSRSKLYVKLEKNRNSIMWGDYLTDNNTSHDDLGRVQRTLTGINGVLDNGKTRLQTFAAQESSSHQSEEIPGNGTAMLYQLERSPIVINSEVVELIVRDKNNPGLVLQSESFTRYTDYSIDFQTGLLRFADVVPTVDSDLNPVFVRISYDLNNSTDEYWVSGLRLMHEFHPRFSAGASLTDDQNPISGYTLGSVSAIAQLSLNTRLSATSAYQTHRAQQNDADAQRVNIEHNWRGRRDYRTVMTWARASNRFDNPAAGISQGREEWRIEHRQPIGNTLKATIEASRSRSLSEYDRNTSASLSFEKTFSTWSLSAGGKYVRSQNQAQNLIFNTLLLGAEKRFTLKNGKRGSFGVDYEQDLNTSERYRLGLSSRLQLHEHVTAYARYELDQGLSFQSYEIDANRNRLFTAGIESDFLPSTKLYSEYRLRGNVGSNSVETASGIRGRYEIKPKLTISPALEVINVLQGSNADDSIAMSFGIADNRNPNRKLSAQAEVRETESSRYYGFRGTVAQRLNVDWTGLLREEFTRQTPDIGELTSRHRMTIGFARRPKLSNEQHALFMANWKVDYGPQDGQDRTTYLLSTHQNRQISSNANLSGRFGARWTHIDFDNAPVSSHVFMSDVRATFDIRRRWELDLRGGWLGTGGSGDGRYSFGFGMAWIAERNLRLGLRYNVVGFREDDLDEQGYNAQGVHIGLQVKFDEDWFKWLE